MKLPRLGLRWYAAPIVVAIIAAGALSGSFIGSAAILKNGIGMAEDAPQDLKQTRESYAQADSEQLPNHYPLVTPTGTVPVEALAQHGRLRNSSGGWGDPESEIATDSDYGFELDEKEIDRLANWQPTRRETRERVSRPASAENEAVGGNRSPTRIVKDDRNHQAKQASKKSKNGLGSDQSSQSTEVNLEFHDTQLSSTEDEGLTN